MTTWDQNRSLELLVLRPERSARHRARQDNIPVHSTSSKTLESTTNGCMRLIDGRDIRTQLDITVQILSDVYFKYYVQQYNKQFNAQISFLELMSIHLKPEPFDRKLRDAFKVLDEDNTGCVVVVDLRHILTSIGEKLEPSDFDEWIREVDVGSDGKIKYEDFIARMVAK
nr:probable calcium-binding protein CML14 [Nicotiana tomentosiformis]